MAELIRCILLFHAVMLTVSGNVNGAKKVCQGDSFTLFQNVQYDACNAIVFLDISVDNTSQTNIACWTSTNCTHFNEHLTMEYKGRLVFENGSIIIRNISNVGERTYYCRSHQQKPNMPHAIQEQKIYVMVSPSKDCKLMIEQMGNVLTVSVRTEVCGYPRADAYFKDSDRKTLNISRGSTSPTYEACLKGPALQCAKNRSQSDYCSNHTTEEIMTNKTKMSGDNTPKVESTTCTLPVLIPSIVSLMLTILIVLLVTKIVLWRRKYHRRNEHRTENVNLLNTFRERNNELALLDWDDIVKLLTPEQMLGLQTYCDNINGEHNFEKHLALLDWDDIVKLLTPEQMLGLHTYCDRYHETKKIETDNQSAIDDQNIPANQ